MPHDNNSLELDDLQAESQRSLISYHDRQEDAAGTIDGKRFGRIDHLSKWLPTIDPFTDTRWSTRLTDRDVGLILISSLSVVILALNLAVTVWAAVKHGVKDNVSDILGAGAGHDCVRVKDWNRWLHFAINVVSTLLLGASNYCAQLLVAPTRKQLDEAHHNKRWFDIGIQSFGNLRKAPLHQKILWVSLMLSSGLLHLFWNSAVFSTTPFSPYSIGYVTADYLDDPQPWLFVENQDLDYIRQNALSLPKLNNKDCIDRYAGRLAGLSSLLLVSANVTMDHQLSYEQSNNRSSLLFNGTTVSSAIYWRMNSDWMCNKWNVANRVSCTPKTMRSPYEDTWTLVRFQFDGNLNLTYDPSGAIWTKIDHCIPRDGLRDMDDKCTLRISKVILSIVTTLNLVKCICIALTMRLHNRIRDNHQYLSDSVGKRGFITQTFARAVQVVFKPKPISAGGESFYIVTLGDAVASFLQNGDKETQTCGLASSKDFVKGWPLHVMKSRRASIRWFHAASWRRWALTLSSCAITIGTVIGLLYMTIVAQKAQGVDTDIVSLGSYGLGVPQQFATALTGVTNSLGPTKGFFFSVLFANMFQAIVSALYLLCNNLLTVMVVAAEWNAYSFRRKSLRVSAPRGIQRSSFFLSLPYKYSVMLMVLSGLLHFFISQSVFVVQTVAYLPRYEPQRFIRVPYLDNSCVGFSSLGIVLALGTGFLLVVYLLFVGFTFKYKMPISTKAKEDAELCRMPLVSTCSAAISANCHAHPDDTDCSFLPVQWGFVSDAADANGGRYTLTTDSSVRPCA